MPLALTGNRQPATAFKGGVKMNTIMNNITGATSVQPTAPALSQSTLSDTKSHRAKSDKQVVKQAVEPDSKADAMAEEKAEEKEPETRSSVSQDQLNELQNKMQKIRNIGISFSVHETTGKTIAKIIDKETDKVIREIPSEKLLELSDKLNEMIGIFFDEKI